MKLLFLGRRNVETPVDHRVPLKSSTSRLGLDLATGRVTSFVPGKGVAGTYHPWGSVVNGTGSIKAVQFSLSKDDQDPR